MNQDSNITWSVGNKIGDWILKWLVGYGVKVWRLCIPITFFVGLGMAFFWEENSLVPKGSQIERPVVPEDTVSQELSNEKEPQKFLEKFVNRLGYSLDNFI